MGQEYFISGIDTDCGKTYITGLLAKQLQQANKKVITTKFVQTGCKDSSEDIVAHRQAMGIDLLPEDKSGLTCPYIYSFPASPHLSAEIDQKPFDEKQVRQATDTLLKTYEIVLSEGAGGLCVPIRYGYWVADYIREHQIPLILVTSSKLGSINHTLLSLTYCLSNDIPLHSVIYNQMPNDDSTIAEDTFRFLSTYIADNCPQVQFVHVTNLDALRF